MSDVLNPVVVNALQNVYATLNKFAGGEDFLQKITTSFGENFDANQLENLRLQWLNNNFDSLPQIEILTGAELQGANAAYAGSSNTIYFSQDFLRRYAENIQAVSSVLLEEVGHYVDWQINTNDTPGDEGELFSALVQGTELNLKNIEKLNQENDSVVLSLNVNLSQTIEQSSFMPPILPSIYDPLNPVIPSKPIKTYYDGNSNTALEKTIKDCGQTRVVFINGILTNEQGFYDGLKDIDLVFNLTDNFYSEKISGYINSIDYNNPINDDPQEPTTYSEESKNTYNPSSSGRGSAGLIDVLPRFGEWLDENLFRPAQTEFAKVQEQSEEDKNANVLIDLITGDTWELGNLSRDPNKIDQVSKFVQKYYFDSP